MPSAKPSVALERIVSGGQTGVDRAALDAALDCDVPVGGWCPKGRRAEDGPIPDRYPLRETPTERYAQRTAWNVRDSDGTLILYADSLQGGTALTQDEAERRGRPCLVVSVGDAEVLSTIIDWMQRHHICVLNVAGPRESEEPGIYEAAYAVVKSICEQAV